MTIYTYIYIYMWTYTTSDAQAIAHHPLIDAHLDPWAAEEREKNSHPLQNSFHMMSYGMEYPSGQFKSAVLILFPPSILGPSLGMPLLCTTLLISNYKHWCVINVVSLLELKHSTISDTRKKVIPSQLKLMTLSN
mgnify:CR=1 FL=1